MFRIVDSNIIDTRIAKLREYLKILREISETDEKAFKSDYRIYGSAERFLQLAIECILDIGSHIISKLDLEKPETYQDILMILGKNGILPEDFTNKIVKMAGFRNILVHGYVDIKKSVIYDHLQQRLSDFDEFTKYIVKFLDKDL